MELNTISALVADKQALILLLMFPVVATIVGIARHIIGIKSLGIYAPVVLTFSLYAIGLNGDLAQGSDFLTGLRFGLVFTAVVVLTTFITSSFLKQARMHYFPKVAIVISMVALALFITVLLGELLGRKGFSSSNIFAVVLIASVAEQFTVITFKKKLTSSLLLIIETMSIAIISYALISWSDFQEFIYTYPYVVLITVLINYLVGKYKGLRIREFIRFREVLNIPDNDSEK